MTGYAGDPKVCQLTLGIARQYYEGRRAASCALRGLVPIVKPGVKL